MISRRTCSLVAAAGLFAAITPAAAQLGPAPGPTGIPADVLSLACAPTIAYEPPPMPLRVTGGQDTLVRRSHAPGDLVTINAGTINGIEVGQQYYVRRPLVSRREPITRATPASIRTVGWIQIWAVDEKMALATITHACETVDVGDYLEPFALPQLATAEAAPAPPQRDNYGRVLMGQDRRRTFAKGDYFGVDRGSDHGVAPGTRFVLYRDKRTEGNFLFELGEAVAVDVKADSATLQVLTARDAIHEGDYVAMRR